MKKIKIIRKIRNWIYDSTDIIYSDTRKCNYQQNEYFDNWSWHIVSHGE